VNKKKTGRRITTPDRKEGNANTQNPHVRQNKYEHPAQREGRKEKLTLRVSPSSRPSDNSHRPPRLLLRPPHRRLIPNRLRGDTVHDQVLAPVQPLIRLAITRILLHHQQTIPTKPPPQHKQKRQTYLQQIRRPKHRTPREMPRIDTHEQHLLAPHLRPVLGDFLRVGQVVVDGDEGAADVGLLV
jgi:hypothetical protein